MESTLIQLLLPIGLAFIMFSLGLSLRIADFRRAFARARALVLGLIAQVLLLPLTAFLIATVLELSPEGAVGLMVLAACPGGVTAGMVTYLARGDTALSISLSAITSVVAFITVPLIVGASLLHFMQTDTAVDVPVGQLFGGLFVVTLLPVGLGLWLSESGRLATRRRQLIHRAATVVFILIVAFTFVNQWPTITHHLPTLGPACLALNLITMLTGAGLATLAGLTGGERVALAIECGIQNSALGITLALSMLAMPALAVPSVIYAVLMNVTAITVIMWRRLQPVTSAA
jgi:BASS family bile acid:Na+ symporter